MNPHRPRQVQKRSAQPRKQRAPQGPCVSSQNSGHWDFGHPQKSASEVLENAVCNSSLGHRADRANELSSPSCRPQKVHSQIFAREEADSLRLRVFRLERKVRTRYGPRLQS